MCLVNFNKHDQMQFQTSLNQALTLTRRVAAEPALLHRLEDISHAIPPQLVVREQIAVVWPATPQSDRAPLTIKFHPRLPNTETPARSFSHSSSSLFTYSFRSFRASEVSSMRRDSALNESHHDSRW